MLPDNFLNENLERNISQLIRERCQDYGELLNLAIVTILSNKQYKMEILIGLTKECSHFGKTVEEFIADIETRGFQFVYENAT